MRLSFKKAVFLDRDGVICEDNYPLIKKENFKLLPNSAKAIRLLNDSGYLTAVVSNQAVVARGKCKLEDIEEINQYMAEMLKKEGAYLDAVYFCPHHSTEGIVPEFSIECLCRKPLPGMIYRGKRELGIENLKECYLVGDKTIDISAGILAGCKTILVGTGYGGRDKLEDVQPMFRARDLYDAVISIILK